jgi:hypothetical protein
MSAPPIHAHADGATCFSVGILFQLGASQLATTPASNRLLMTFPFK